MSDFGKGPAFLPRDRDDVKIIEDNQEPNLIQCGHCGEFNPYTTLYPPAEWWCDECGRINK